MSPIIQNILAATALIIAVIYLIKKFVWNPNKQKSKNCGGDDGCGCH